MDEIIQYTDRRRSICHAFYLFRQFYCADHDRVPRAAPGHPSAARAHPQPHAHQNRHRDADHAQALQHAAFSMFLSSW